MEFCYYSYWGQDDDQKLIFVEKGSGKIEDEYITGLLKDEWIK